MPALRTLAFKDYLRVAQIAVPTRVYPEHTIGYAKDVEAARMSLATGKYDDIQFAVEFEKPEDVMKLDLQMDELERDDRASLLQPKLCEVCCLTTGVPSGYKSFPVGKYPDPLYEFGWEKRVWSGKFTSENIKPYQRMRSRVFWLIVKAPRGTPSGLYKGEVTLSLVGKNYEFPVRVEVTGFDLPTPPSMTACTGLVGFALDRFRSSLEKLGLPGDDIERFVRDPETGDTLMDRLWQSVFNMDERLLCGVDSGGGRGITTMAER